MDKKLILICSAIIVLAAAFIYMSFSPNTSPLNQTNNAVLEKNKVNTPPPPPPSTNKARRTTAPPPPPTGDNKNKKVAKELPQGYKSYEIINRPEPIQVIKMGSTKLLKLEIEKGSEDFTIEWFKKNNGSQKKVNIGSTFSVSPEKTVTYYVATISDNINHPENIYFQVEALGDGDQPPVANNQATAEPNNEHSENLQTSKKEPTVTKTKPVITIADEQPKKSIAVSPPEIKKEPRTETTQATDVTPAPEPETPKEKFTIIPTENTNIKAKAGTPLNIGYKVEGKGKYKVFWFHRPFNKKKGALIKKRTKLNFGLKRLNKYHNGYFYIQIKDSSGKFYKAPEYKVVIK